MLNFIKAVIYGIVEGITEWLPVSSTGHMILLNELMPMEVSEEFWSMFVVVIQLGAIIAVILYYWKTIWPVGVFQHRRRSYIGWRKEVLSLWGKIIAACIPAGVVGVLADDWLDEHLYNWQVVSAMLILVGIAFVGDSSVTDVVEVFCLVLCIGVVIIDDTEVAIEGCRDASHVTFVAKVLVAVSFFVPEVLFRFCKPC